jgi:hypothetical protein
VSVPLQLDICTCVPFGQPKPDADFAVIELPLTWLTSVIEAPVPPAAMEKMKLFPSKEPVILACFASLCDVIVPDTVLLL